MDGFVSLKKVMCSMARITMCLRRRARVYSVQPSPVTRTHRGTCTHCCCKYNTVSVAHKRGREGGRGARWVDHTLPPSILVSDL